MSFKSLPGLCPARLLDSRWVWSAAADRFLAVPLMMYVVGVPTAHTAIGTSAFAVAVNAGVNLLSHASAGTVKWWCAGVFAAAGIFGAFGASTLSKLVDGPKLLGLFAVLMLMVAGFMFVRRSSQGDVTVQLNRANLPKLLASGFAIGALSGFFGIGGGFLIVPGMILATGMPVIACCSHRLQRYHGLELCRLGPG
jgi:uncharacterized membrane protein YfcA